MHQSKRLPFSSFKEISKNAQGRNIVFWGAGEIAVKTSKKILPQKVSFIIDNNQNIWGTEEIDIKINIFSPSYLKENKKVFILICTTSFIEVADQLQELGFIPEQDFIVSPILNDLRIIAELESIQTKLLFSSGTIKDNHPQYGGGIYELSINEDRWEHTKIHSGRCHGMLKWKDGFVAIDQEQGLLYFDKSYSILKKVPIAEGTRGHGIAYSEITDCFYIVSSHLDRILVYTSDFIYKSEIKLSNKHDLGGRAMHHPNDICIIENSIYVSMFSYSGNHIREIFDGVVLEIDLLSQKIRGPVITNLWMPHNVAFHDGSLVILDSLRGYLRKYNAQSIGEFPGFTRGLAYDGIHYFIGQSRNRNFSKYIGLSKNISIDASIIIFDEQTKVSRSIQLPSKISEIHSILHLQ